jgi:hypothetical protein
MKKKLSFKVVKQVRLLRLKNLTSNLLATLAVFGSFILLATLLFLAKIIYLFYPHFIPTTYHHQSYIIPLII